ncbi:Asx homology domain-containing protein [Apodospora peruviana]|uniref:Asx homology domain-containing protein n=1 Tax=Apodospora peruviana TaxID=516989 RepID=A0AAE0IKX7_9PEZI|nr:Asx homology domain-containing protein [Apodospora peruviana]
MAESSSPLSSPPESAYGSPEKQRATAPFAHPDLSSIMDQLVESKKAVEISEAQSVDVQAPEGPREDQAAKVPEAAQEAQETTQESITINYDGTVEPPQPKRRRITPTRKPIPKTPSGCAPAVPRKTAKARKWEAPFVYTDAKSPLTQADLRAILLLPEAWNVLATEEKKEVLAQFLDETHILGAGTEDARPDPKSLRNDDDFRHDCVRYLENIETGKHDEDWLYQAWVAHEKHKRGDFDDFLRKGFKNDWGITLPKSERAGGQEGSSNMSASHDGSSSPTSSRPLPDDGRIEAPAPVVCSNQAVPPSSQTERACSDTKMENVGSEIVAASSSAQLPKEDESSAPASDRKDHESENEQSNGMSTNGLTITSKQNIPTSSSLPSIDSVAPAKLDNTTEILEGRAPEEQNKKVDVDVSTPKTSTMGMEGT